MEGDKRFNIRVYGLWVKEKKLLVNEELIKGKLVTKFPGGGLEFGEGTIDCLKREWKEELNLDIQILQHYYTTDFFQASAFGKSQVLSIYYLVNVLNPPEKIINHIAGERTFWMAIADITEDTFTLPIDKLVGKLIVADA